MNKKKILVLAMTLSMVAILAIGGTIAYFTDVDSKNNVFTVGNFDIILNEDFEETSDENPMLPAVDQEGVPTDGFTLDEAHIKKEVTVTNESNQEAYVRVLFALEDTKDVASAIYLNTPYFTKPLAREGEDKWVTPKGTTDGKGDWLQVTDGTNVYTVSYVTLATPVAAGATTDAILKSVALENTADNAWHEIVDGEWELKVVAQGAQVIADTATESIDTAFGWAIGYDADDEVAALFQDAFGGTWTAHTYTDEGAWVEGDGVNK